jgi:hypothetical protein
VEEKWYTWIERLHLEQKMSISVYTMNKESSDTNGLFHVRNEAHNKVNEALLHERPVGEPLL